jgi:hypothetical protein
MTTQASQKWTAGKEKPKEYQDATFIKPVASCSSEPPTSSSSEARSSAWPMSRAGGQVKNRGYTANSLASSSGTAHSPLSVCRPWLTRYSCTGRLGSGGSHPGGC